MNLFSDNHQELLSHLLDQQVDFIIVGGYSVIFHGYARTTGDVDIWLNPTNENKEKFLAVLEAMDFFEADIQSVADLDFTSTLVFAMGEEPEKAEFLTRINLINFEEANKRKIIAEIDGLKIPFLHLDDLVLSKFNTSRLKDQADIEELQRIQNNRKS
ncbi:MAG: nucleotidyltransferase [Bacteroidota bacterium]